MTPVFTSFVGASGLDLERAAARSWKGHADETFAAELSKQFGELDDHHRSVGLWLITDLNSEVVRAMIRHAYALDSIPVSTMASHAWDRQNELGLMEPRPARQGTLEELLRHR